MLSYRPGVLRSPREARRCRQAQSSSYTGTAVKPRVCGSLSLQTQQNRWQSPWCLYYVLNGFFRQNSDARLECLEQQVTHKRGSRKPMIGTPFECLLVILTEVRTYEKLSGLSPWRVSRVCSWVYWFTAAGLFEISMAPPVSLRRQSTLSPGAGRRDTPSVSKHAVRCHTLKRDRLESAA